MTDQRTETDPEPDPFVELLKWVARQAGGVEALAKGSKVSARTLGDWLNGKYPRQRASPKLSQLDDWALAHIKSYPPEDMPRSLADLAGPIGILASAPPPARLHRLLPRRRSAVPSAPYVQAPPDDDGDTAAAQKRAAESGVRDAGGSAPTKWRTVIISGAAAAVILVVAVVYLAHRGPSSTAPNSVADDPSSGPSSTSTSHLSPSTFRKVEQAGKLGANTFADPYQASGQGGMIGPYASVTVSCRVYAPSLGTLTPDGYWYRLESAPWQNRWAPANSFMNGDVVGGPVEHNTDFQVPVCR